ncbi:MAG TPA: ABC transporter substrate-binding protein [Anaerolineae bacterium]
MANLSLNIACWEYDRTRPLMNGQITPEGIDLHFTCLRPEETFERQVQHREFDVSEFSLSYLVFLRSRGDWPYAGIPVFLSRFFRHSCIYIHSHAGIERPQDLAGKTVGVPWYPMTAAVWMRALLQHEYDLAPEKMAWLYAQDVFPWTPPAGLSLHQLARGQSLETMLESGEVAALFTARQPAPFLSGSPNVRRLFPNYRAMEEEYFRRTRLFPIMHTVIVRREIAEQYPWVPASLFKAFEQAKRMCYQDLHETDALRFTLPWLMDEAERTERVMGEDFWPYGIEANRHVVQSLVRYSHEQGLAAREIGIEEIFAPVDS